MDWGGGGGFCKELWLGFFFFQLQMLPWEEHTEGSGRAIRESKFSRRLDGLFLPDQSDAGASTVASLCPLPTLGSGRICQQLGVQRLWLPRELGLSFMHHGSAYRESQQAQILLSNARDSGLSTGDIGNLTEFTTGPYTWCAKKTHATNSLELPTH